MTAVHGSQLNKPGLGSSTLRKNGSRIVPRNLSQANASLFRNIRVGGSWGSQSTQIANFQALRFSANPSGAAPRAMGIFGGSYNVADNLKIQNGSNSFYAGQVVGQGISMALGILNQFGIIGNNKAQPQGAGAKLDNALSNLNTNSNTPTALSLSGDVTSHISAMDTATTKEALTSAISSAEAQVGQLESMQGVYEAAKTEEAQKQEALKGEKQTKKGEVDKAQSNVTKQESKVSEAKTNRDKAIKDNKELKKATKEKTQAYYSAKDSYVDAQNATKRASDAHNRAKAEHDEASKALGSAQNEYNTAKSSYENAPDTITEGNPPVTKPNPEKAKLKAQMEVAQQKLDQAKIAEEKAETAEKNAKAEEDKAKGAETKAKEAMDQAETAMKEAAKNEGISDEQLNKALESFNTVDNTLKAEKDKLLTAQESLDIATENLTQLEAEITNTTGAAALADANKNNLETLSRSVSTNKQRLAGMSSQATSTTTTGTSSLNVDELKNKSLDDLNKMLDEYKSKGDNNGAAVIKGVIDEKLAAEK